MHAYSEYFIDQSRQTFGWMLDYAVHTLHFNLKEYYSFFLKSSIAQAFGNGSSHYLVGVSGVELTYAVFEDLGLPFTPTPPIYDVLLSEEYWCGWSLAYYQWLRGLSFAQINAFAPIEEIKNLYHPYHEMDIMQFVDKLDEWYLKTYQDTALKRKRIQCRLSQQALADLSGIPVRTIQQYEQRKKNINKAQAEYVVTLASLLHCSPRELLEPLG